MTGTKTTSGFTPESFDLLLSTQSEPAWMTALRREAWAAFDSLELPNNRQEDWRRTDLRLFKLDRFALPTPPPNGAEIASPLLLDGVDTAGSLTSLDSHPIGGTLDAKHQAQGVYFGPLSTFVEKQSERIRPHLERRIVDPCRDKFAALNGAFWNFGTLLYVPRGVTIDRPLHTLASLSPGGVDLGRTLVVLEEDAEATLLAETGSATPTDAGLHCGTVEILVGPRAKLRYVNLQNWGTGVWHFAHHRAQVDSGGKLQWTVAALGARLAKVDQHVVLHGRDANAQVNGVMFTEGKQHLSYHTRQEHTAPHCQSDLLYKGALQDRSRLVWRGMIRVEPDAQKTDAYQRDDNLILSDHARADSIPGLEIEADDVKCSHGATAGRVDEDLVFYAQCRGLTRKEAVRMIVAGFFQQVIDRIPLETVRNALGDAIRRRVREYD